MSDIFKVRPPEKELGKNPYSADVVAFEKDFSSGRIRIEPPVTIGEELLVTLEGDVRVQLEHLITAEEATLLGFCVEKNDVYQDDENVDRVRQTVAELLKEIGYAASGPLLNQQHRK